MRYGSAALAMALVLTGCGKEPEAPPEAVETPITVQVDWPIAREPGFVGARWVVRGDPNHVIGPQEGPIPSTGVASAQFRLRCIRGWSIPADVLFEVTGYFEGRGEESPCVRRPTSSITCTEASQSLVVAPPEEDQLACFPPDA